MGKYIGNIINLTGYTPYTPAAGDASPGIWKQSDLLTFTQNRQINMYDPYWASNTLLLNGNGTNGAQNNTFLDSSANNLTITRNGTPTQGSFSPYGSIWSNYFSGSSQYLTWTGTALGSGDFTVECWVNAPAVVTNKSMLSSTSPNTTAGWAFYLKNGTTPSFYNNAADAVTSSVTLPNNQWVHVAAVRSGTTLTIYLNGVSVGSGTFTSNLTSNSFYVASDVYSQHLNAYISNVRHVVGTAVYTSNFTPSIVPLTAIANTKVLTCQSNRFIDASSNNYSITVTGAPTIQRFAPFITNAPYESVYYGGGGYFNGSTDYLNIADNTALQVGSSDFTIEAWVYPSSLPSAGNYKTFWSKRTSLSGAGGACLVIDSTGALLFFVANSSITWGLSGTSTGFSITTNSWQHLAMVRSGNNLILYKNGVAGTTVSMTFSVYDAGAFTLMAGSSAGGQNVDGYMTDFRLVKGTAVYTANFTPSPSPLTAITNTSALVSYTNAGVSDSSASNQVLTSGSAQISTTQSKYGGSSVSFNGTNSYLYSVLSQNFAFGTGDFTIELWVNPTNQGGHGSGNNDCLMDFRNATGAGVCGTLYIFSSGTGVYWYVGGAVRITGGSISNNTWTHIAVCRASGSTRLFINGVQSGSTYADSNSYIAAPVMIGQFNDGTGGGYFNGYIDDIRITNGVARYKTTFTPPTSQLQNC